MNKTHPLGRFATSHSLSIVFVCIALCLAGIYSAFHIPSSVFPQTNFPRVVILVDNGVMPGDEMMAAITRPIEESMKDIPGVTTAFSSTGRSRWSNPNSMCSAGCPRSAAPCR
jgi:multidrug efflux pump subunit AcrB